MDMNSPPDLPLDMETLMADSMGAILRLEDPQLFLDWIREHIPDYLHDDEGLFADHMPDLQRMALILGRALWSATPLPGNGYRPSPLPPPGRNDPCPCGSGRKFKKCCRDAASAAPPLDTEGLWPLLAMHVPLSELRRAANAGQLPLKALVMIADDFFHDGKPAEAEALLAPLFESGIKGFGDRHADALDLLCTILVDQGRFEERARLLRSVVEKAPKSPLRSCARQRLTAMHADEGDFESAREEFGKAMKDDPDSLSLSHLEVIILIREGRLDQAKQRALFWLAKLSRLPSLEQELNEDLMNFLRQAATDPAKAAASLALDAGVEDPGILLDWLDEVAGRPVPEYSTTMEEPVSPAAEENAVRQGLRDRLMDRGVDDDNLPLIMENLMSEIDAGRDDGEPEPGTLLALSPPESILTLDTRWSGVFPLPKPVGIQPLPFSDVDPWAPEHFDEWLAFLDANPEAFDSLWILDDLATALEEEAFHQMEDGEEFYAAILDRCHDILDAVPLKEKDTLSWSAPGNRPALRSLARLVQLYMDLNDEEAADTLVDRYLRLNPGDNHGLRLAKINNLLRRGEDREVLEFAGNYPDDDTLEIPMARVLALYRLNKPVEASVALKPILGRYPDIANLLAVEAKPPSWLTDGSPLDDMAPDRFYAWAMGDVWRAAPGTAAWLKKQAAGSGKKFEGQAKLPI